MKNFVVLTLVMAFAMCATAQDKPRVFVQGKGSENLASSGSAAGGRHWASWGSKSTVDSHDESMEVTKEVQKNCSSVILTLNQSNADYTVMLNRESKQNRGLLRTNNQVQVANRMGDILGTNSTRTVGNAAKDACELVVADWQAHGRLNPAPAPASSAVSVAPAATPLSAPLQVQPQANVQPVAQPNPNPAQPESVATGSSVVGSTISDSQSVADAARRQKQHQSCLELAKDNPSITCQ